MSEVQSSASIGALKARFQLHKYLAAAQAENHKNRGLQILLNRMDRLSDSMVLKTVRQLGKSRALDMVAITGVPIPGGNPTSTISIQERFGLPGVNTEKDVGFLLEAIDHAAAFFRKQGPPG